MPGVTPHTLRHTLGSTATSSGEALALTGAILGHTNLRSTAIYAHVQHDPSLEAVKRVEKLLATALSGKGVGLGQDEVGTDGLPELDADLIRVLAEHLSKRGFGLGASAIDHRPGDCEQSLRCAKVLHQRAPATPPAKLRRAAEVWITWQPCLGRVSAHRPILLKTRKIDGGGNLAFARSKHLTPLNVVADHLRRKHVGVSIHQLTPWLLFLKARISPRQL